MNASVIDGLEPCIPTLLDAYHTMRMLEDLVHRQCLNSRLLPVRLVLRVQLWPLQRALIQFAATGGTLLEKGFATCIRHKFPSPESRIRNLRVRRVNPCPPPNIQAITPLLRYHQSEDLSCQLYLRVKWHFPSQT